MKQLLTIAIIFLSSVAGVRTQKSPVYAPHGIALDGYDPVAFFTHGKPVKGSSIYSFKWMNTTWQFADKTDLESFEKAPEKYAPQYGGYCAYGAAKGVKASVEADTWTIMDGKLYFNYDRKVKDLWNQDRTKFIDLANKQWPQIVNKE